MTSDSIGSFIVVLTVLVAWEIGEVLLHRWKPAAFARLRRTEGQLIVYFRRLAIAVSLMGIAYYFYNYFSERATFSVDKNGILISLPTKQLDYGSQSPAVASTYVEDFAGSLNARLSNRGFEVRAPLRANRIEGEEEAEGMAGVTGAKLVIWPKQVRIHDGGVSLTWDWRPKTKSGLELALRNNFLLTVSEIEKTIETDVTFFESVIAANQAAAATPTTSSPVYTLDPETKRKSLGVLAVLLSTKNGTPPFTKQDFEQQMIGNLPTGSLRDYFVEVSSGRLEIDAIVTDWIHIDTPREGYFDAPEKWFAEFRGALKKVDVDVDLSALDKDGDGAVDVVLFVHDTPGAEVTGGQTGIWSSSWRLSANGGKFVSAHSANGQSISVDAFSIVSGVGLDRKVASIGTFAHQIGHALGLEDQYASNYAYDESAGAAGNWSLMGTGSWVDSGTRPTHLSGPEKLLLGWVDPVDSVLGIVKLEPIQVGRKVLRFPLGPSGYLVLENRQRSGFDSGIPAAGLLVWNLSDSKVRIIEADGRNDIANFLNRGDSGDPFPSLGQDSVAVGSVKISNIELLSNGDISMRIDNIDN